MCNSLLQEWLEALANEIKLSLKLLLLRCLDKPAPLEYPSQVLCLNEQINFTFNCESVIKSRRLKSFKEEIMVIFPCLA